MTERELEKAFVEMANVFGWAVFHARPAKSNKGWRTPVSYQGKGYPDLTLVRERLLFIELKVRYRGLTAEQQLWRDRIRNAGGEWHLITDKGWNEGKAEKILGPYQHPIPPPSLGA